MRTTIKDSRYFELGITESEELIQEMQLEIENKLISPENIQSVQRFVFSLHLHLAISRYSSGLPIKSMALDIRNAINMVEENWLFREIGTKPEYPFDWYSKMIWILSISYLLEFSEIEIRPLLRVIDRVGAKDWLIEYLVSKSTNPREKADDLVFSKPYKLLKKAVEEVDPGKSSVLMKQYLEKEWYKGHRDAYWHNSHLSRHNAFFGYWSFESVAVVKISGIDDTSFKANQYYPEDMLNRF